jgi:hypothetical protein
MNIRECLIVGGLVLVGILVKIATRGLMDSLRSGDSADRRAEWSRRQMLREKDKRRDL